jgi:hypothetical protein
MMALIAAAASMSSPALQPALAPWSYLVGHCWVGPAPENAGQDKHCFESVFGGQHVRDRHVVVSAGRAIYAGESIYSAQGPKVVFTYWNSLGGVGTGDAVFQSNEWRFSGSIRPTSSSAEQPMSAAWRKVDGGYEVREGSEGKGRLFKRGD